MSDELTPITRKETFLAKAGGQNVVTPTPITREETFLQAIIDNGGGGGGTGGGVLMVNATYDSDYGTYTLDKTWNEINTALRAGTTVYVVMIDDIDEESFHVITTQRIFECYQELTDYFVGSEHYYADNDVLKVEYIKFIAENGDAYPVYTE